MKINRFATMRVINVYELIGTVNAILHSFGVQVHSAAIAALKHHQSIELDFSGLRNTTSAFFHASVGNLYRDLGEDFFDRVQIQGIEDRPDWQEKIDDSIDLIRHPNRETATERAISALFED